MHACGYTYNDIKLDNILVGDHNSSPESLSELRLIDFGFAEKYRKSNGEHVEQ